MTIPARVEIVEVGPRDGLQNESLLLPVADKAELIELLARAGLIRIEAGSFVSPAAVPQMASTDELFRRLGGRPGLRLSALVPNLQGLTAALSAGVREIAVFAAASETFSHKNINCSIAESIERFAAVVAEAIRRGVPARGYISCALGCPYEGEIAPRKVAVLARELRGIGCGEISLGDTIGVGTPLRTRRLVETVAGEIGLAPVAVHFHDTYGQALANIFACLEFGVSIVDASVAGLGGCPHAPGARGNVATEDVVYMLNGMGVETGIKLKAVLEAGAFISKLLGRLPSSSVGRAFTAKA